MLGLIRLLGFCRRAGIAVCDPRPALRAAALRGYLPRG